MSSSPLDRLLAEATVLVVIGPGGVGKTTVTAALGCRAVVEHGRRVLLVTIDPARRLADALGVAEVPDEPVLVPLDEDADQPAGRLWASMIDMAESWDDLVRRIASPDDAASLLANPLYRSLTTRFIQSHDYIALDHLSDLAEDDRYDLVVIDTPPSSHAIDILDAPDRMIEFFDSRLLRWLTAPYQSRLAQVTARPFLAVAERLLGGPFLARIAELFWLFSRLRPGFVRRAGAITARLADAGTGYVVVSTSEPAAVAQTEALLDDLDARAHGAGVVIHNRAVPTSVGGEEAVEEIVDPSLREALRALLGRDRQLLEVLASRRAGDPALHTVPWVEGDLASVAALTRLLD